MKTRNPEEVLLNSAGSHRRRGLTLMELVVVMGILVALATLIIPRITGIMGQAGIATNAALLQGINEAEARYEAQFNQLPSAGDGIVTSAGTLYVNLHPALSANLDAQGTALVPQSLTDMQAKSLNDAGMAALHFQDDSWAGAPSESGRDYVPLAAGVKCCFLTLPTSAVNASNFDSVGGHNVLFSDRAFSIHPFTSDWNNNFIVVGFGNESTLKRNAVQDTPVFASAQPNKYYARGLCVYMIPASGVTATTDTGYFAAKYVGCFAPDGTCLMDNVDNYSKSQTAN
ncbi:MAG TPA: type II secretion system protein [Pirellulales bacterium]|jgi:type II secretory pathway pseudopilin PulG|nr:type II secretion system protein [Pirellulales bacterium]